jgi:dCMP deaminase
MGKTFLLRKKKVGALIVKDRMIISDGYNGTPSGAENCCEDEEGKHIGMCFMQKQMPF